MNRVASLAMLVILAFPGPSSASDVDLVALFETLVNSSASLEDRRKALDVLTSVAETQPLVCPELLRRAPQFNDLFLEQSLYDPQVLSSTHAMLGDPNHPCARNLVATLRILVNTDPDAWVYFQWLSPQMILENESFVTTILTTGPPSAALSLADTLARHDVGAYVKFIADAVSSREWDQDEYLEPGCIPIHWTTVMGHALCSLRAECNQAIVDRALLDLRNAALTHLELLVNNPERSIESAEALQSKTALIRSIPDSNIDALCQQLPFR